MHKITNPKLKAILKQADEAYMDYLKAMKLLRKEVQELRAKLDAKKSASIRSKIKKLK